MKTYKGQPGAGPGMVTVWDGDDLLGVLQHHVYHSPDGHSWGYGGSGPSELAKDLLWDVFDSEPTPDVYQQFKAEVVATWPMDLPWVYTEGQVRAWEGNR